MQAHGQMHLGRLQKSFEPGGYTGGRNCDSCGRPAESPRRSEDFERRQQTVQVVERFAHAHENDVGEPFPFGQRPDLVEDFVRRKGVLEPCRPVAQKRQPIRQPACDEMQSVARSPSGM